MGVDMTDSELAGEVTTLLKLSAPDRTSVIQMARRLAQEAQQRDETPLVGPQRSGLS